MGQNNAKYVTKYYGEDFRFRLSKLVVIYVRACLQGINAR